MYDHSFLKGKCSLHDGEKYRRWNIQIDTWNGKSKDISARYDVKLPHQMSRNNPLDTSLKNKNIME